MYASSSVGSPRCDTSHLEALELGEQQCGQLALAGCLDDQQLLLVALLDGYRSAPL